MKKFRIGLIPRIVIAIALGVALGGVLPDACIRLANTFNAVFDQFLKFMVPLIILGLVTPAIAETGRGAGRMLLCTVAIAYVSTLFSGFLSYFVSDSVFPYLVQKGAVAKFADAKEFAPYVKIAIPPLLDVMSALVLSFVAGLGMVFTGADVLRRAAGEFRDIVARTIDVALVPLLPVFIFGVFLDMTAAGKTGVVLAAFAKIIVVFSLLSLVVIALQYAVAGAVARRNPFKALWTMLPAYLTALGTSSSAATIPVTLRQTLQNGVKREVADFVIPLCATVHLAGSTLKLVSCSVALMLVAGDSAHLNLSTFAYFIAIVGVVMVAAPGVPGGAVMAALGVLQSVLVFDQQQIALMIALYLATDSIGTACNVTGDGAIALIVDRMNCGLGSNGKE